MISYGSADDDDKDFLEKRRTKDKNEEQSSLVQIMFSWSLSDVFNCDLFKGKVHKIPQTFTSLEHYFGSFTTPLIEETHEDLRSSLEKFSDATAHVELQSIQMQKSKQLFYRIEIKNANVENGSYQPMNGDIFVLTRTKPRDLSDLTRNATSYIIGYVDGSKDNLDFHEYIVELSCKLEIRSNREAFFIAFLLNMTTSIRIWNSLNLKVAKERNLSIINEIVSYISSGFFLTKIVGTLGPKSRSIEVIEGCLLAGMSVARFDFSWLSADYHQETLDNLKTAMKNVNKLCADGATSTNEEASLKLAINFGTSAGIVKPYDRAVVFQKIGDSSIVKIIECDGS